MDVVKMKSKEQVSNKNQKKNTIYLKRVKIYGICCIVLAIIILIINLISNSEWYEYLVIPTLLIAGVIFIYASNKIKLRNSNKITTKKKC